MSIATRGETSSMCNMIHGMLDVGTMHSAVLSCCICIWHNTREAHAHLTTRLRNCMVATTSLRRSPGRVGS